MTPLESAIFVSSQLRPEDMDTLAARGVTAILNHRPDGEEPGQPVSESIHAAAEAAGLTYRHAPVSGRPGPGALAVTAEILGGLGPDDRLVMFCRSGMRSTACWALTRLAEGADPQAVKSAAQAAGYDLSALLDR